MSPVRGARPQAELLVAAGGGDRGAFEALVAPHRRELLAHCYRMLASPHDAEDALQDALLRAWRGIANFGGRSSLRSWLYRIATNACLDASERRGRRQRMLAVEHGPPTDPHDGIGTPLVEQVWVEPWPDEPEGVEDHLASPEGRVERRESIELAFVAALQHLPARQRAVLVLREVLGFSAKEVGEAMETSVASVNSALQRARATLDEKLPERSQQATLEQVGDDAVRALVERYADAWERGDVETVMAMLVEDAALSMPPMATWFLGAPQVRVFLEDWAFNGRVYDSLGRRRVKVVTTRANGQPAFGVYSWMPDAGAHRPTVLQVLALTPEGRIAEICGFVQPELFPRFGLPAELP